MDVRKIALRALLGVALLAYVAGGMSRISFNVDVLKLLPTRLGTVTGLSLFARHFSRPTELIVTVEAADADAAEAAVKALEERLRATPGPVKQVVSASPWETRPQDLSEFLAYLLVNLPPEEFGKLLGRMAPETIATTLQETKETLAESFTAREVAMASYDPLGLMRSLDMGRFESSANLSEFGSADGTFRVMYVEAPRAMTDYRVAIEWMKSIRAAAAEAKLPPDVRVNFTGEPAFVAEISARMQWDMASSGNMALVIVGAIFWIVFRRVRPMADLIGMVVLSFFLSLGTAGWVLGELSIIGVGFTSIMIGLSVDYGYMIYQASLTQADPGWIRRRVLPYVLWAAVTTSAAFFTLNASSMPGLKHLGNLVGLGVIIGAGVMLTLFVPLVSRTQVAAPKPSWLESWLARPGVRRGGFYFTLALVGGLLATLAIRGFPSFDSSGRALKMRHSEANDTLERLSQKLSDERDFTTFIVTGADESALLAQLRALEPKLQQAETDGTIESYLSPLMVCPDPGAQAANLAASRPVLQDVARLKAATAQAGFREDAFVLTQAVFDQWKAWAEAKVIPIWPNSETSSWILRRLIGREPNGLVAAGLLRPAPGAEDKLTALQSPGVHLVSWPLLARELRHVIPVEFAVLIGSLMLVIGVLLVVAFRSVKDLVLMAGSMALVFLALMGAMAALGMQWNAFNIAAIMLLLGTGTDYSIYVILSLKRTGGDVAETQRNLGLVIFLCACSSAAGFGALAWVGHMGLASLGETCALGLVLDALIAVFLLPVAARKWRDYSAGRSGA